MLRLAQAKVAIILELRLGHAFPGAHRPTSYHRSEAAQEPHAGGGPGDGVLCYRSVCLAPEHHFINDWDTQDTDRLAEAGFLTGVGEWRERHVGMYPVPRVVLDITEVATDHVDRPGDVRGGAS